MSDQSLAILGTGLVTSVGLTAAASCAAIRAKVTNPSETGFIDSGGEWIMGHAVPLDGFVRGNRKLVKMLKMALADCLQNAVLPDPKAHLLLCLAERGARSSDQIDDGNLFAEIQDACGVEFSAESLILPHGRVGVATALRCARKLVSANPELRVIIAATDSLLNWPTLGTYAAADRLLTSRNSNGFLPGEGAGALLVGAAAKGSFLFCTGLGFATETSTIDSQEPLRGDGLTRAISTAVADAGCELNKLNFRITDLSGEQYYFKEASLALSRTMRDRKEDFDIWHPAECTGELGSVSGIAMLSVADAACRKGYAPGPGILCHTGVDTGQRAAIVLQFQNC